MLGLKALYVASQALATAVYSEAVPLHALDLELVTPAFTYR